MIRWFLAALALLAAPALAPALAQTAKPRAVSAWERTVVVTPDGGYRMGNPNAKVKLVEYGSRTCPICGRFAGEAMPNIRAYVARGTVSFEFRDYPVHGAVDLAPILLGRCVTPAQYFPVLEHMFAEQKALIGRPQQISAADEAKLQAMTPNQVAAFLGRFYGYTDFAARRGMAPARVAACLGDKAALDALAKRADDAGLKDGVNGTPTFLINGQPVYAVNTWAALEPALKAAGAK